jgi:hypothetical protein
MPRSSKVHLRVSLDGAPIVIACRLKNFSETTTNPDDVKCAKCRDSLAMPSDKRVPIVRIHRDKPKGKQVYFDPDRVEAAEMLKKCDRATLAAVGKVLKKSNKANHANQN